MKYILDTKQREGFEKFKKLKVGAFFTDAGGGKTLPAYTWAEDISDSDFILYLAPYQAIPASPVVENIIKSRNYDFGVPFTQQYYSKALKSIIRQAGIDRKVIFSRTEGGVMTHRELMHSDLIGTHTARRTFATNAYLMGLNPLDIMKITGHKTFAAFIRYIRCENMAVALRISEHEFFNMEL